MDFVKKKPLKKDPSTFEAIIKKQRRASCGYAPSDCSSDEEPGTEQKKKQKYGYTAVPTTEPAKMEDIALTSDWGQDFSLVKYVEHNVIAIYKIAECVHAVYIFHLAVNYDLIYSV